MVGQSVGAIIRHCSQILLPLVILSGCAWVLSHHLNREAIAAVPDTLGHIAAWQWAAGLAATALSFVAVAKYDVLAHKALATGVAPGRARYAGAAGIAVGQTAGFGLLTGALARWRMLPELPFARTLQLSTFVSISFVLAWVMVTGLICLLLPAPTWTWSLTLAACLGLPAGACLLFFKPVIAVGQRRIALPSLGIALRILWFSCLDMVLAAAALWVFFPADTLGFASLLPLFLIALGCGLVSNTPGGVGPFELVFVTATPPALAPDVLAAIVAFRLVYYAVPATCAVIAMVRPSRVPVTPAPQGQALGQPARSEAKVLAQSGGAIHKFGQITAPIWPTGQTRTLFTDHAGGAAPDALDGLVRHARATGHVPFLYKSGKRLAAAARHKKWSVLHVADDAVIATASYDIDAPGRRQLRRKLRAACKAGVAVVPDHLPTLSEAQRVDAAWRRNRGRPRGGSMGMFDMKYVQHQWVGAAYSGGKLVALVTFHRGHGDWCLDIMRHGPEAPDGTMHSLVHAGKTAAHSAGARTVCLAGTVACPDPASGFWRWAARQVVLRCGGMGLRQFKSAFAPVWVPRYAAAPTAVGLVVGLCDVARAIWFPPVSSAQNANGAHYYDENNELASYPQPCEWSGYDSRKVS